jgi:hypothetical protein
LQNSFVIIAIGSPPCPNVNSSLPAIPYFLLRDAISTSFLSFNKTIEFRKAYETKNVSVLVCESKLPVYLVVSQFEYEEKQISEKILIFLTQQELRAINLCFLNTIYLFRIDRRDYQDNCCFPCSLL